ncbi:hypothetical protein NDU88_000094 [Pleurodeles waltl]|uniref:C-type lectin domain-containing protein n=1 Tax=Pleurodeles waltl TaxID=8319 RepID=A0AAV7MFW7_PLEWA|nr:hypothetical protein NDU88_000094 [Pleurodeles waltl]
MGGRGLSCLLLHVASLVVSGQDPVATLCSGRGLCYSLHSEARGHRDATCAPQGRLTPMRDEGERRDILTLLEEAPPGLDMVWIGLSKPPAQCVVQDKPLRGFQWAPGDEASEVDLWGGSPEPTCTSARCVALQRPKGGTDWHWKEYSCSKRHPYICRHQHQGVCSSLDLSHAQLVYPQPFLPTRSAVFSPPGTEAMALCHSGHQNVTVACRGQAGGYQWVSPLGVHPICPYPAGYEPTDRLDCVHTDECQGTPCKGRVCCELEGAFTCFDEAPVDTTGGLSPGDEPESVPGTAPGSPLPPGTTLAPTGKDGGMVPGQGEERATSSPSAEPGPTAPGSPLPPGTGPAAGGAPVPTSAASAFSYILVPAILAAVTMGILALLVGVTVRL